MKRCAYRVSTSVSHIVGKRECEHPPRYTFMGKDYCARCIVKAKADDYGRIEVENKKLRTGIETVANTVEFVTPALPKKLQSGISEIAVQLRALL